MSLCFLIFFLTACDRYPINNPYPRSEEKADILYSSFAESPKTFDPARSYSSNEYMFISQIYEPPLQYHYLKRPYTLMPLSASKMPTQEYLDKEGNVLPQNVEKDKIAFTIYTVSIKPNSYYQPHPAFAKDAKGQFYYHNINEKWLESHNIHFLQDFQHHGTRELVAEDFAYQIKRLADPKVESPILGLMDEYIVDLSKYSALLQQKYRENSAAGKKVFLDLRDFPLEGVKVLDRYTYQIKIKGYYAQFIYWLAMPFFAPVPWEVSYFDSQAGMRNRNLTMNWYPVGTGPYMLIENNPNQRMVLTRNPNFHGENYPAEGMPEDKEAGLLKNADKPLPFIDRVEFYLEKESIPRWNKFLQGYYDGSGISSDNFQQVIQIDSTGEISLTPQMQQRGLRLRTAVEPSSFYLGFNMLDDVVGGRSGRARKLRQAISIALDYEEFISIFANGRGVAAHGPVPPGIFGYEADRVNPYVYTRQSNRIVRRPIEEAKQLLAKAGYPDGRNAKTGKRLVLHFDVPAKAGPDDKARLDWMRKQFDKLGIDLNIRATQYNRFQEKMRVGQTQLFEWGWHADYPDPENFFFLLYGPHGKVKEGGENASNYSNPTFDRLFEQMKQLPNGEKRLALIRQMLAILQKDAPWAWGYFPKIFVLSQPWNQITKPHAIANNTLKYQKIDPELRAKKRIEWNQPIWWPLIILLLLLLMLVAVMLYYYHKMEYYPRKRI